MNLAADGKFHGDVQLEHIVSHRTTVAWPEVIGPLTDGFKLNFYITGGEVLGPKCKGKVRPFGGDYVCLRPDGIAIIEVKGTWELDDGALIHCNYDGLADLGPDAFERTIAGDPPALTPARAGARYYSGHPSYTWLNRLQCFAFAIIDIPALSIYFDIYAAR